MSASGRDISTRYSNDAWDRRTILSVILLGNKVDGGLDLVVGKLMLVDDVFEVRQGIGTEGVTVFAKDLDSRG
jgi:hypothetical protein